MICYKKNYYVFNMKIAIIFWGLARSLNYTIESINKNILNVLKENDIEYDIYFHTYFLNNIYNNPRSNEKNIKLDNNLYKLLKPKYFIKDNQEKVIKDLDIKQYYPKKSPFFKDDKFLTFKNYILALNSLKRISKLAIEINKSENYDYVIYMRPDVLFTKKFDIKWFDLCKEKIILTPSFHKWGGLNDRFSIGKPEIIKLYGYRFNYLEKRMMLISERLLKFVVEKDKYKNIDIEFVFKRIRADGKMDVKDVKL